MMKSCCRSWSVSCLRDFPVSAAHRLRGSFRAGFAVAWLPTLARHGKLNIDGARYELLLPPNAKMLAVSVTASSFVINDHAKPKDYSHFFVLRPDSIWPAGVLNSPPPRSHVTPPLCRRPFGLRPALPRPRAVPIHTRATG